MAKIVTLQFLLLFFGCCRQCHNKSAETVTPTFDKPPCVIDTKYPIWFFNPPVGTVSGFYHDTVSSITDAKIRATGYHSMRFHGKFRYYEDGRSDDFQDSISFYFTQSDTVLAERLMVADSFFMCCTGKIYLLAKKNSIIDTSRIDPCAFGEQEKNMSKESINATGEYRFEYYNQSLSWMHAEENAVKELCDKVLFHFASLKKMSGADMSTTIMKQYDLIVRNITIVQRRFDAEDNICRVIISCNTSDIKPASANEATP